MNNKHRCTQCGTQYPGHIHIETKTHVGLMHALSREQVKALQKHASEAVNTAVFEWLGKFVRLTKPHTAVDVPAQPTLAQRWRQWFKSNK